MLGLLISISLISGISLLLIGFGLRKVYGVVLGDSIGRGIGLLVSLVVLLISIGLWVGKVELGQDRFEFKEEWNWKVLGLNYDLVLGVDSVGMFFVLLTTLLLPVCILGIYDIKENSTEYVGLLLVLEGVLLIVFTILDIIGFYIFFEAVLIPMYLIVGIWGSRERKKKAGYYLFIYTLLGSVLMLLGLLLIYVEKGTGSYEVIYYSGIKEDRQYLLFLAMLIAFGVKVPMVPVHIWLPEAHVEAPTIGSVILAGVLLKLGTYGMIRFMIPLLPVGVVYFKPVVYMLGMIGIIYTSLTAIRQIDMKRIIAYASVAHMNMTIVGLFSETIEGYKGAILQMLSHGLVSGGLFICVGILYERYHSRLVKYYSGVGLSMPLYGIVFLLFTLGNIGFPGTSSFVGEFLILVGIFKVNTGVAVVSGLSMILGGGYSLWLYNRVVFGNIKVGITLGDMNRREMSMLMPLLVLMVVVGVYGDLILMEL